MTLPLAHSGPASLTSLLGLRHTRDGCIHVKNFALAGFASWSFLPTDTHMVHFLVSSRLCSKLPFSRRPSLTTQFKMKSSLVPEEIKSQNYSIIQQSHILGYISKGIKPLSPRDLCTPMLTAVYSQ